MVLAKLVNIFERVLPRVVTAPMITIASNANKRLYSTALTPDSSLRKSFILVKDRFSRLWGAISPPCSPRSLKVST